MKSKFVLSVTLLLCLASIGQAQEPATEAAAEATSAGEQSAVRKAYEEVFGKWKTVLGEIREIHAKAKEAEDTALPNLVAEREKLILEGETLIPKLRDAAIAVYNEAPNEDKQISRWLSTIAQDHIEKDRFDEAKLVLDALLAGKSTDPTVVNNAGVVAFINNDFATAKDLLKKAADIGVLSGQGQTMYSVVDKYAEYWEEEKKLRDRADKLTEKNRLPRVKLETNRGVIILELFEDEAPETVGNFVHLVESGFYDGLTFHRVLPGFMAQGGCPEGTGKGGPGYTIFCECYEPGHRKHFTGSLSMAKTEQRDTGGSQFFITFTPQPQLNGKHTVFGRVVEGLETLPTIKRRSPDKSADLAITPDRIIKAEVLNKRDHEYTPNKVK